MPHPLDYHAPQKTAFPWRTMFRIAALGPMSGALIGGTQATAPFLCWLHAGQPDFYFRGWDGVDLHYFILILGGGVVGLPYGLFLWGYERYSRRQIRIMIVVPTLLSLSFLVSLFFAALEFRQMKLGFVHAPEGIVVMVGLLLSITTSRTPRSNRPVSIT